MGTSAVVIYQSKYGATRRYAQWLSKALDCPCMEKAVCQPEDLQKYDTIIFGGGIYATGIAGISLIKKQYSNLQGKRVVLFAVGASPEDEAIVPALRQNNLPEEMHTIPLFYLRGAFDEGSMKTGDKLLIKMLKSVVLKKAPDKMENWERALAQAIGKTADWTAQEAIEPVLAAVRG